MDTQKKPAFPIKDEERMRKCKDLLDEILSEENLPPAVHHILSQAFAVLRGYMTGR